ncbi:MAG TPA: hypothetical protein VN807_00140, partial [Candidatus Sulfotelmatobacter sp.]|nr:hypothetical protein [Candidatus Sulfotelmatobacter sp.]
RGPRRGPGRRIHFAEIFEASAGRDQTGSGKPGAKHTTAGCAAAPILSAAATCSGDASEAVAALSHLEQQAPLIQSDLRQ